MVLERAMKSQPEFALQYSRALLHYHALCHIQRKIATGTVVPGWVLPAHDLVTRENGKGRKPGRDVLCVKNGLIWVIPLNEELEFNDPKFVINGDEKPISPDSILRGNINNEGTCLSIIVFCSMLFTFFFC